MSLPVSPSITTHSPFTGGAEHKTFVQHSGFTAGQNASYTHPTNQFQRPPISCLSLLRSSTFARLSMLWSPAISCSTCSKAPIFHFAVAETYRNLGQGVPPPPPSPSTLMLACKFWIKTCFGKIIMYNLLH